jgi:hypothetical protein
MPGGRQGELYRRIFERHTQRWFSQEEIRDALSAAGFHVASVIDDYGDQPVGDRTVRETWVAQFVAEG